MFLSTVEFFFFKIKFFSESISHEYHQRVKRFGSRSGPGLVWVQIVCKGSLQVNSVCLKKWTPRSSYAASGPFIVIVVYSQKVLFLLLTSIGLLHQLFHPPLTHISLASFLWDIGNQNSPRCNAAKRGVPSGAILFAHRKFIEKLNKK